MKPPVGPSARVAEAAPAGRKEKESLRMPEELPSVNDVHHWLAMTAAAVLEASTYDDRADVACFPKLTTPT